MQNQEDLLRFLSSQSLEELAALADVDPQDVRDAAALLVGADSIVILWGERIGGGERGTETLAALTDLSLLTGVDSGEGSGLIEVPAGTNARGLREVGCLPNLGPGLSDRPGSAGIDEASAFYLLHVDPLRELPDADRWRQALDGGFVVAHAQFLDETLARHADVVFPAESHAEKEGTVTHPDGRIQRLRPAIGHPGAVRMEWQVLVEIADRLGVEHEPALTAGEVWQEIARAVPFYGGITLDEIGGRGVRWPEREASVTAIAGMLTPLRFSAPTVPPVPPRATDGKLPLAPLSDLWASPETEHSPALSFLRARQELQLHPATAAELGVGNGDEVEVASNGHSVRATAALREATKRGCAYLIEGTAEDNANVLLRDETVLVEVRKQKVES